MLEAETQKVFSPDGLSVRVGEETVTIRNSEFGTREYQLSGFESEEPVYPYSSIVIIPYTSRIQGVYDGDKIIQDPKHPREAQIRLSSFSAMVTAATELLYKAGASDRIIALGENTFGLKHRSTADLMKDQLVRKGVPENVIIPLGGLQDTNEQLEALKQQDPKLLQHPLYIVMDFHKDRVEMVLSENWQLLGTTRSAEDVFMDSFQRKYADLKEKDPVKYKQTMRRHRKQLRQFTPQKVRVAESVFNAAAKLGPLGDVLLKGLRVVRGGQTVTDYHSLTTAKKHLEVAKQAIREGKLKPVENLQQGITTDEVYS